jgi:ribA/ribD-fused uncharacterized protein
MERMMIGEFQGEYRWLSNFWPARVEYFHVWYPTVEHAYQAAKCDREEDAAKILACRTPGQAKRLVRGLRMRSDWNDRKLAVMRDLVGQKFDNPALAMKLIATGNELLVEGNSWHDTYWGVCNGKGENHLGKILMEVRRMLQR